MRAGILLYMAVTDLTAATIGVGGAVVGLIIGQLLHTRRWPKTPGEDRDHMPSAEDCDHMPSARGDMIADIERLRAEVRNYNSGLTSERRESYAALLTAATDDSPKHAARLGMLADVVELHGPPEIAESARKLAEAAASGGGDADALRRARDRFVTTARQALGIFDAH
jgi:hypothetical protein